MTTIIVTYEDNEVDEFEFDADTQAIGIGRRSTNDVCIPNLSVSGMHARITLGADGAWIEDLNSTNGTYINGRLISRQRLNESDEIIIGKARVAYLATVTAEVEPEQRQEQSSQHSQANIAESAPRQTVETVDADDSYGDFSDIGDDIEDDSSMSLSDKAKLALGRPTDSKPRLKAIAGSAAVVGAATTARKAGQRSSNPDVVDTVMGNVDTTSAATIGEEVGVNGQETDSHPLDGIERMPTSDEVSEFDDKPSIDTRNAEIRHAAVIEIKNGAKSGQVLPIDKPVTTLGRPGIQIAAIMRKPDGYFVMHIESDDSADRPTLNSDAIGDEPMLLHSGDELNVAGIDVEFMLS